MRIALVAHLSEVSGAGVALVDTASGLASAGHQVTLILPGQRGLEKRAQERGLNPVIIQNRESALGESSQTDKLNLMKGRAVYMAHLARFLRENDIELVYVNSSASVFAGIAARAARRPVAWHIHETLDQKNRSTRIKTWMIRRLSAGLIYASRSAMSAFPPGPLPYLIARNAIDFDSLAALRQKRLTASGAPGAIPGLFLNGTIRRKGADILLQAALELEKRRPDLNFNISITGSPHTDPAFYQKIVSLANQPGLAGRVRLLGIQPSFLPLLKSAAVFISASRNEAMPISIVEAMAAGVPVIATSTGDCADLLDDGSAGLVIPSESSSALAGAIEAVLDHPDKAVQRAEAAFEKAGRLYGGKDFWKPLNDFLGGLVAGA